MKNSKLKTILKVSILFFVLHALEEYLFKFYLIDPSFAQVGKIFNYTPGIIFIAEQIFGLALLLITIYKPHKILLVIVGLVFIIEVSHPIIAIVSNVYAGLLTSIPLILLGILYWKNLLTRE
jgi:hypothetical protein